MTMMAPNQMKNLRLPLSTLISFQHGSKLPRRGGRSWINSRSYAACARIRFLRASCAAPGGQAQAARPSCQVLTASPNISDGPSCMGICITWCVHTCREIGAKAGGCACMSNTVHEDVFTCLRKNEGTHPGCAIGDDASQESVVAASLRGDGGQKEGVFGLTHFVYFASLLLPCRLD